MYISDIPGVWEYTMRAADPRYKPLNTSKWYSNDIHRLDMVHAIDHVES